jgi:protein ImuB
MTRIVSIWLPNFPLERRLWRPGAQNPPDGLAPASADHPFALTAQTAKGLQLTAVNGAARKLGLKAGMALTDARALFPALRSASAAPDADGRTLRRLALWCTRFAPSAAVDGENGLRLDIAGAAHLWGGEASLIHAIEAKLAVFGFTARLGVADTHGAAWALARYGRKKAPEDLVAIPGQTHVALAGLPIEALRLAPETALLLKRLGLYRIGDLYDLPRASLRRRFPAAEAAEAALLRLDQALGEQAEPAANVKRPPAYAARLDFAEPLISAEGVRLALETLAKNLAAQLAAAQKGARGVTFRAYLVCGGCSQTRAGLSAPSRNPDHFLRLLQNKVDQFDAGFGVESLRLSADVTEELPSSQRSFSASLCAHGRNEPSEENAGLPALIDRIANRLGPDRVLRLSPQASWLPERANILHPALATPLRPLPASFQAEAPEQSRPFLLLDRPEPITVLALLPEGPPRRFLWRRASHRVTRAEGPERIAPEWWRELQQPPSKIRDYYRVEDENGRRYWLFREGLCQEDNAQASRWRLHGVYG